MSVIYADADGDQPGVIMRLTRDIRQDEAVAMDAVELDESRLIVKMWREQMAEAERPSTIFTGQEA